MTRYERLPLDHPSEGQEYVGGVDISSGSGSGKGGPMISEGGGEEAV